MGVRTFGRGLLTVALVLAATVAGVAPVSAHSAQTDGVTSLNRAGYTAAPTGLKRVHAAWTVPTATCGHGASYATVRISMGRGSDVTWIGTAVDCHAGSASYYAWTNFGGRSRLHGRMLPGDRITAAAISSNGGAQINFADNTQGWGVQLGCGGACGGFTRAMVGVAGRTADSGLLPLTNFGSLAFYAVTVDKQSIGDSDPQKLTMQSPHGIVKADASDLRKGRGFTVTWRHA
jgi:hypothetical protein